MFTLFPNTFFPNISGSKKQITSLLKLHPTPFFLIEPKIIQNRITTLINFFKKQNYPFQPAYSCKTNYSLLSLPLLHQHHLFAETVSEFEYQLARKSKFSDSQIIVNGPHKQDLPLLLSKSLLLHLDNLSELNQVITRFQKQPLKANLGVRINTLLQPSHFGFNLENGQAKFVIFSLLNSKIPVSSLHLHLGSNLYDPNLYTKSVSVIINFIKDIYSNFGLKLKYLDLGGGFPSHGLLPHHLHTQFQPLESYLKPMVTQLKKLPFTPTLILEPGRYLIDDAAIFISKVIHSDFMDHHQQIIIDSTINQLPLTWTRPNIVAAFSPNLIQLKQSITPTTIYGASCQEIDILYQGNLPKISPNDLIIFYCCGAYNQNMTPDFIFPKPKTYFL
jgi:diaminopimelate decarboxylase